MAQVVVGPGQARQQADGLAEMLQRLARCSPVDEQVGQVDRDHARDVVIEIAPPSIQVSLGEADAGFVYKSDVTPDIADKVIAIQIPDAINTLATYPIAVTDNAADAKLATDFIDYVLSDEGQDILVKWNFISYRIPALPANVTLPTYNGNGTFTPLSIAKDTNWGQPTAAFGAAGPGGPRVIQLAAKVYF